MSVLKLPVLVDLQHKAGELVLSVTSCLQSLFYKIFQFSVQKRCGYGNFNRRCNVSPIHLRAVLGVGNFTKVIRVCADRL
jgi:hypothetical protein